MAPWHPRRWRRGSSWQEGDGWALGVGPEPLGAVLAPDAGVLEAAERSRRVERVLVDRHVAAADPPRDGLGVLGVRAPDAPRKPVARVVGQRHRVVLVGVGD